MRRKLFEISTSAGRPSYDKLSDWRVGLLSKLGKYLVPCSYVTSTSAGSYSFPTRPAQKGKGNRAPLSHDFSTVAVPAGHSDNQHRVDAQRIASALFLLNDKPKPNLGEASEILGDRPNENDNCERPMAPNRTWQR